MDANAILERLAERTPFALLVRGCLDWFFDPGFLDAVADDAFRTNSTRDNRFSGLAELLVPVLFTPWRALQGGSEWCSSVVQGR